MTPEEEYITDGLLIQYSYLKLIDPERAIVRISWSRYGILDIGSTSTHIINITKDQVSISGFPITLTGNQAYLAKYSTIIDTWNPNHEYEVLVTVNGIQKTQKIYPALGASLVPAKKEFIPSTFYVGLRNTERGVKISVGGQCSAYIDSIRKVTIEKVEGISNTPVERYVSSVPVSYTLDNTQTNYPYLIINNEKIYNYQPSQFNEIYNNRANILFYIVSSNLNYIEVTDLLLINTYRSSSIVKIVEFVALNPEIHTDATVLYYDIKEEKYYQYRANKQAIPSQFPKSEPTLLSKWGNPAGFKNGNTTFNIYIDGSKSLPGESYLVYSALQNSRKDATSYNLLASVTTPAIDTLLPVGVNFMDSTFEHVDTEVSEGLIYKYRVIVEDLEGDAFPIFQGAIERESLSKGSLPIKVNEDQLAIPMNPENSLYEDDFQSGPANGHLKVVLSDRIEDYLLYLKEKEKENNKTCLT